MKIIISFERNKLPNDSLKKEFVGDINNVIDIWRDRSLDIEMVVE